MPRKEYQPPQAQCWKYDAGDGWQILAGKTDEDNDILSLRLARQEEHWFHINGMPGSHVILRAPNDTAKADKRLIEMAAAVAAWHSKARNGGKCTVSTTLAKHVSKPRGAKPGTVEITHESLISVKPALPPQPET